VKRTTNAVVVLLLMSSLASAQDAMQRGQQLAEKLCAHCHAIGKWQRSPLAGAPPFRQLEIRIDFEELQQRLQEGIISGHPAMPTFILSAAEARALIIYLKAIRE
jgi:cytochrome c